MKTYIKPDLKVIAIKINHLMVGVSGADGLSTSNNEFSGDGNGGFKADSRRSGWFGDDD